VSAIPEAVAGWRIGLLVPPRDVESAAYALARAAADNPCAAIWLARRRPLETDFSAARMVEETLAIYHELGS